MWIALVILSLVGRCKCGLGQENDQRPGDLHYQEVLQNGNGNR